MWFKWLLVGILVLGVLLTIGRIGAERKPYTPVDGVVSVVFDGLLILGILHYWK